MFLEEISQFLLKWFVGFRTSNCMMESLTIEKMQTLQVAFSFTFRTSPNTVDASGSFTLHFKTNWAWGLWFFHPCAVRMLMTFHRVCRHCDGGWASCHTWWELCPDMLTVLSLEVVQWVRVKQKLEIGNRHSEGHGSESQVTLIWQVNILMAALIQYWVTSWGWKEEARH